ncbi:Processed sterol regulatory element-binding 1 [Hyphodiscus hymeniophilus]|uniref:Processed sterol regulatory element-binding 1 n=1 Tax=Hyphodiscus hymeniophilus TaxID=353542 RepID=A0A9P6VNA2_9HELO|nr:Processed sterol regulatory element-binding 1 [Hyphodiscus hymeniophilus]
MEVEEWTDWMRWDVGAIEADLATSDRKHSYGSTHSICNVSDASPQSTYSMKNELSFKDAPFEFDESFETSQVPLTHQQTLQEIAMPYRTLSQPKPEHLSPTTSIYTVSRSPSPEIKPATRKTKKRKSLVDDDEMPNSLCQSRKRGHNAIEKRYRTNLNDKIACLRQGIPPLWRRTSMDSKSGDEGEDSDNETGERKTCQKYGKAAILTRALEYIQHLEGTAEKLGDEVDGLKMRVGAFERLAMSGSVLMSNAPQTPQLSTPRQSLMSIQDGMLVAAVLPFGD